MTDTPTSDHLTAQSLQSFVWQVVEMHVQPQKQCKALVNSLKLKLVSDRVRNLPCNHMKFTRLSTSCSLIQKTWWTTVEVSGRERGLGQDRAWANVRDHFYHMGLSSRRKSLILMITSHKTLQTQSTPDEYNGKSTEVERFTEKLR